MILLFYFCLSFFLLNSFLYFFTFFSFYSNIFFFLSLLNHSKCIILNHIPVRKFLWSFWHSFRSFDVDSVFQKKKIKSINKNYAFGEKWKKKRSDRLRSNLIAKYINQKNFRREIRREKKNRFFTIFHSFENSLEILIILAEKPQRNSIKWMKNQTKEIHTTRENKNTKKNI